MATPTLISGPVMNINCGATPVATSAAALAAGYQAGLPQVWSNGEVTKWGVAGGAITAGDFVIAATGSSSYVAATEALADEYQPHVGVALATAASGDAFCISLVHENGNTLPGVSSIGINIEADTAANAQLATTGTAGRLGDGATTAQHKVDNIHLDTATATTAAEVNSAASWNHPSLRGA